MQKITITDFTGGIQEAVSPNDFSPRQWAQLKGIVPSSNVNFETQWAIQTIGSESGFQAIYPLTSTDGVFLVGIKTNGTLWWATMPDSKAAYGTANAVSWTQITTAKNTGWAFDPGGTNPSQAAGAIQANVNYKFLCSVPVPVYKYVKTPNASDTSNPKKDTTPNTALINASGVLINTAVRQADQQVVIAYIDNSTSPVSVSALVFPNLRRFPLHGDAGDFINADIGSGTVTTLPTWGTGVERMHPYTYIDQNGALLPGTGIIPRANVGTMKGDKLILGDIEWRTDQTDIATKLSSVEATWKEGAATNSSFGQNENGSVDQYIQWPENIPNTAKILFNQGPGIVYLKSANTITTRSIVGANPSNVDTSISSRKRTGGIAEITTYSAHGLAPGNTVQIVIPGTNSTFEGTYVVVATPSSTRFTYAQPNKKDVAPYATVLPKEDGAAVYVSSVSNYDYKIEVGQYQVLPNDYPGEGAIYVHSSTPSTKILINRSFSLAKHLLNDNNTGPYRGSIYYAEEDLDEFDPRSVLKPSKSDVRIAGLHSLDDTIIVITTAGTSGDGVLRIRGFLSQLHPYSGTANPTAVRIELVRGGIGAPERTTTTHKNYSAVWSEAGIVVFVDRLGGVFYTDGAACDRLDRFGPRVPLESEYPAGLTREDDHVATLGKHLFVYRGGRLLCFTMLTSDAGRSGAGCWTELVLPAGNCKSFVGGRDDLYFINSSGQVMRYATQAPVAERGKINGTTSITVTVSTATIGSQDEHDRTNWSRFGMTFNVPSAANGVKVTGISVRSSGALAAATTGSPNQPTVYTVPVETGGVLDATKVFDEPAVMGEFEVKAGIGTQANASATVTFTGYLQLKSASFWTTGRTARRGDK